MHSAGVRRRAARSPSTSWSGRCAARGTPVINCKAPSISEETSTYRCKMLQTCRVVHETSSYTLVV
eukprot:56666-Prymnesium_polylepis.1